MAIPLGIVIRALSAFFIVFPHLVLSKVYRRCELAQELRYVHGISMSDLPTWICIAQHESQFDTSAKNAGSGDHGIFQISEIYWCSATGEGLYACGLPCSAFQDDDITDDVECAKKIYNEHTKITGDGYNAWTAYPTFCKNSTRLPLYIVGCFDEDNFIQYSPEEIKSFEGFKKSPVRQSIRYSDHPNVQFLKVAAYAHQKLMFDPPLITTVSPPNALNTFIESSENELKSQGKQLYALPRGYSTTSNSYNFHNSFGQFSNPRNFPTTSRPIYRGRSRANNQFYPPSLSYPTTRTGRTRNLFRTTTFPYPSSYFLNNNQNYQPDIYDSYVDESRIDSIPIQQQISQDVPLEKSLITDSLKHHHRPIKIKHKFTLKFTHSTQPASQFSSVGSTHSSSTTFISSTSTSSSTPSSTTASSTTSTSATPSSTASSSNSSNSNTSSSTSSGSTTTEKPLTDAETVETSSVSAGTSSNPSSSTFRPTVSPVPVRPSETPIHELFVTSNRPFKHKPIRTKRPLFGHNHFHHQYERSDGSWEILKERSSPIFKTLKSGPVITTNAPIDRSYNSHFFIDPGTVFAHVNESGYLFSLKSNGFKFSSS